VSTSALAGVRYAHHHALGDEMRIGLVSGSSGIAESLKRLTVEAKALLVVSQVAEQIEKDSGVEHEAEAGGEEHLSKS
jgi:hypothetical protein